VLPLNASQYATASFLSTEEDQDSLAATPEMGIVPKRLGSVRLPSGSNCPAEPANGLLACNVASTPLQKRPLSCPIHAFAVGPSSLHFAAILGKFRSVDSVF
jgi:hypothetical protein